MPFVPGKVVREFEAGGKKVRLRYPRRDDVDGMLRYINSIVRERTFIGRQRPVSRKEEVKWLSGTLRKIRKGDEIRLVVEVGGKVVGSAEVKRKELDANRHVGMFGIGLMKDYRGMGIGTELANALFGLAKKEMGIRIVQSSYYSMNRASESLHKKVGFREIGRIPKGCNYYGKYFDDVIMYREV